MTTNPRIPKQHLFFSDVPPEGLRVPTRREKVEMPRGTASEMDEMLMSRFVSDYECPDPYQYFYPWDKVEPEDSIPPDEAFRDYITRLAFLRPPSEFKFERQYEGKDRHKPDPLFGSLWRVAWIREKLEIAKSAPAQEPARSLYIAKTFLQARMDAASYAESIARAMIMDMDKEERQENDFLDAIYAVNDTDLSSGLDDLRNQAMRPLFAMYRLFMFDYALAPKAYLDFFAYFIAIVRNEFWAWHFRGWRPTMLSPQSASSSSYPGLAMTPARPTYLEPWMSPLRMRKRSPLELSPERLAALYPRIEIRLKELYESRRKSERIPRVFTFTDVYEWLFARDYSIAFRDFGDIVRGLDDKAEEFDRRFEPEMFMGGWKALFGRLPPYDDDTSTIIYEDEEPLFDELGGKRKTPEEDEDARDDRFIDFFRRENRARLGIESELPREPELFTCHDPFRWYDEEGPETKGKLIDFSNFAEDLEALDYDGRMFTLGWRAWLYNRMDLSSSIGLQSWIMRQAPHDAWIVMAYEIDTFFWHTRNHLLELIDRPELRQVHRRQVARILLRFQQRFAGAPFPVVRVFDYFALRTLIRLDAWQKRPYKRESTLNAGYNAHRKPKPYMSPETDEYAGWDAKFGPASYALEDPDATGYVQSEVHKWRELQRRRS